MRGNPNPAEGKIPVQSRSRRLGRQNQREWKRNEKRDQGTKRKKPRVTWSQSWIPFFPGLDSWLQSQEDENRLFSKSPKPESSRLERKLQIGSAVQEGRSIKCCCRTKVGLSLETRMGIYRLYLLWRNHQWHDHLEKCIGAAGMSRGWGSGDGDRVEWWESAEAWDVDVKEEEEEKVIELFLASGSCQETWAVAADAGSCSFSLSCHEKWNLDDDHQEEEDDDDHQDPRGVQEEDDDDEFFPQPVPSFLVQRLLDLILFQFETFFLEEQAGDGDDDRHLLPPRPHQPPEPSSSPPPPPIPLSFPVIPTKKFHVTSPSTCVLFWSCCLQQQQQQQPNYDKIYRMICVSLVS